MSQWDSAATNLWFDLAFDLAPYYFKWADPTTRFCKGHPSGTLKSNLPNIPLRAHCPDCKFSFTACTNCPLRIKKSSGIATANPDSATPTTQYPKPPSVANPWGHIPAGYVWPSACEEGWNIDSLAHRAWIPWQAWKAIMQSPGMHLMLHCLLCIIETKNFGDFWFCGMASASAVDGNYLELIHDIQARCWLL